MSYGTDITGVGGFRSKHAWRCVQVGTLGFIGFVGYLPGWQRWQAATSILALIGVGYLWEFCFRLCYTSKEADQEDTSSAA